MIWNERIRNLREDADLNQTQMGKMLSLSQNAVSKYENSERSVPVEIVVKYALYFKVTTDYILGLSDNPKR